MELITVSWRIAGRCGRLIAAPWAND